MLAPSRRPQQRGLPRAVGPRNGNQLALRDRDLHVEETTGGEFRVYWASIRLLLEVRVQCLGDLQVERLGFFLLVFKRLRFRVLGSLLGFLYKGIYRV